MRKVARLFEARIPNTPQSVEFVRVAAAGQARSYERYAGAGLTKGPSDPIATTERARFVTDLTPTRLP